MPNNASNWCHLCGRMYSRCDKSDKDCNKPGDYVDEKPIPRWVVRASHERSRKFFERVAIDKN